MTFELAQAKDRADIFSLYRTLAGTEYCAWTDHYPGEEEMEGDLARNGLFCLKNEDGQIIGVISVDDDPAVEALTCWTPERQPSAELSRLGVRVEYQNQGIARLLLQHGMEELKKRGYRSVHFLVCKTNLKAIRSYDKLGFDIVGECSLFDEEWWCYEKELL